MFETLRRLLRRTPPPPPVPRRAPPARTAARPAVRVPPPVPSTPEFTTALPTPVAPVVPVEPAGPAEAAAVPPVIAAPARDVVLEAVPPVIAAPARDVVLEAVPPAIAAPARDVVVEPAPMREPEARPEPPAPAPLDATRAGVIRLLHARLTAFADAHGGAAAADLRSLVGSVLRDPLGSIPQLPESAQQAMALTREAQPAMPKVVAAFERDPALAQALLQQANSASYANLGPCASVRDALLRLGMAGARAVLLSHAVDGLFATRTLVHRPVVDAVAAHLVRTATIARHLAPAFDAPRDEAYTAALLHDVGKLVLLDRLTQLRDEWRREPRIPWPLLRGLLAESHEALGGLTVHAWGLGQESAAAITAHHRQPAPLEADRLGQVICVAERVDIAIVAGTPFDLAAVLHWHRITGASADRIAERLPPQVLTGQH